jgi:hypothetical protein
MAVTSSGIDVTGTVEFNGLSGTGSVTVTDILDQDDMSSNSATALATQQSIKAYVDANAGSMSNAQVRAGVEAATDSNVFTDADHSKLNGIEASATADQTAAQILTAIKTVDGSGSGLDADTLDGVQGASYLRSDAADTVTEIINFNTATGTKPLRVSRLGSGSNQYCDIYIDDSYTNFKHVGDENGEGRFRFYGDPADASATVLLAFDMSTVTYQGNTVWHAGNDGAGSGLDADTLDGLQGASYLRSDADDAVNAYTTQITFPSNTSGASTSGDQSSLEVRQNTGNSDAFMAFHVAGDYAGYFGLDGTTNDLFVGGWSYGANKHKIWHAGNDGSGSGLDADTVDGLQVGTGRNSTANEIVRLDGSGYAQMGWINTTSGATSSTINRIYCSADGYIRYMTPANLFNQQASALLTAIKTVDGDTSGLHSELSQSVTGSAFATTGSPESRLEYQQANGQSDTKLAPNTEWHNTIRMGHGNPYSYYSNTLAMRMTGTGTGTIFTQTIINNVAQGWKTVWDSSNDGSGSGLDADTLDGIQGASYLRSDASDTFTGTLTMAGGLAMGGNDIDNVANIYLGNVLYHHGDTNTYLQFHAADSFQIVAGGAQRMITTTTNTTFTTDITVADQIMHEGDTNTYMQFHAADQWRVVTGGSERLEVNNSAVTVAGVLSVGSAIDLIDNKILRFGTSDDVEFFFSGSHMYTDLNAGNWYIRDGTTNRFLFDDIGDFHADANIFAYSTSVGSDRKLKDNIEVIESPLEKIQKLNGVTFNWKRDGEASAGVIAQDVQKVLPSAVKEVKQLSNEGEDATRLNVDYNQIIGLLVESVKELKKEIEELKKGK